jgi:starch synthase (maltosyl-transferring)
MATAAPWTSGPRIYNLFPLLAGPMPSWTPHLERAARLGFDWLFVNAFHLAGYSGSLYSVKDYYAIDPRLLQPDGGAPERQLTEMLATARRLGLRPMMDLVLNHTAFDSALVRQHPEWYRHGPDGAPVHPTATEGDHTVTWGDLFEIDNDASADRDGLWEYWATVAEHYAALGFEGFRCDAAYKVPDELWRFLFARLRRAHPGIVFVAETLGCPAMDTVRLARLGFDFVFNSAKWWDFRAPWCLEQYRATAPFARSISFPESHDTERLAAELGADARAAKLRYAFAALFASGVLMPIGFEYGFRRRLDVVKTSPADWEEPTWDLESFITAVNRLKASRRVFNEDGPLAPLDTGVLDVFAFAKSSVDGHERALVVLNLDRHHRHAIALERLGPAVAGALNVEDVSPEGALPRTADGREAALEPSAVHVFVARMR